MSSNETLTISEFTAENFKSIQEIETLRFGDFTVFVGKNDAGKSSLLEALKIFLQQGKPDTSHFHKYRDVEIEMEVVFEDVPESLEEALSEEYQSDSDEFSVTRIFNRRSGTTPGSDTLVNGESISKGAIIQDDEELTKAKSRSFIWDFMPKPIHIFAERDVSEETKLKSGTLLNDLLLPVLEEGGVGDSNSIAETRSTLEDSLNDTSQKIAGDLTESMQSHMPDLEAIEVNPGSVSLDKAISPTVKLKDKYLPESVDISERGSGVGSLFILSLMEAYVDMQVGEGYFILFEEPGNSLHPGAERKMLDALKSISEEGGQVTITTHSQVFIDRTDHSQLYIVSRDDGESGFKQVEQDAFEAVDEIGAKNSDILQSDFVFYVEGASDVEVIEEICSQKYDDWESKNVSVQHLGGTGNLTHCDPEKLKKINRNCAFILDSDRDSESDEPNSTAQNLKQESDEVDIPCKILNRSTIENYFTAYGVNQTFGVSAEEGFIGDYDDAVDLIKQEAADRRPDGDPDYVNYNKIKHGREIVESMYENGQRIYEIEEFIDDCL
jgi:putative ATP-dependent endonuclease of OLD family